MDTIKEFSLNKLLTETTELGRDLKLIRNGCYLLIFVLSICFFIYILSADRYEQMFLQAKAQGNSSGISFVASVMSGKYDQQLIKGGEFNQRAFAAGTIFNIVALGVFAYTTHFLAKIFSSISDSVSPFNETNVKYLRIAAKTLAGLGIPYLVSGNSLFTFVIVELSSSFLYALSMIFQYGVQLQQLSDETF